MIRLPKRTLWNNVARRKGGEKEKEKKKVTWIAAHDQLLHVAQCVVGGISYMESGSSSRKGKERKGKERKKVSLFFYLLLP